MNRIKSVILITILFFALLLSSCSCSLFKNHDEALEYLRKYEDNPNIVYVDNQAIYFGNRKIEFYGKEIDGKEVKHIIYVDNNKIYFYARLRKKESVYFCDHNFEKIEKICDLENVGSISMSSEREIRYTKDGEKYIYNIEDGKTEKVQSYPETGELYAFLVKDDIGGKNDEIVFTKKQTGEKKVLRAVDVLKLEQAKTLKEITGYFDVDDCVREKNGTLYISFLSNFIVSTYSYDFETGNVQFLDWSEASGSVHVYILD